MQFCPFLQRQCATDHALDRKAVAGLAGSLRHADAAQPILAHRRRRQFGMKAVGVAHHPTDKGVAVGTGPHCVAAARCIGVTDNRCFDLWNECCGLSAVQPEDHPGRVAIPERIRRIGILAHRVAPADDIIARPVCCPCGLQHNRHVLGEDALPVSGAGGEENDGGRLHGTCLRQYSRRVPVGRSP